MNNINRLKEKIVFALKNKNKKLDKQFLENFIDKYALKKYKSVLFES